MTIQNNRMDDSNNRLRISHKEVKEGTGSSTAKKSNDFVRKNAELAFKAAQKRQEEAKKEQIATREIKDTKLPDSPSIETEEYKDIRENARKAAEGRIKETIAPDSPNVEQQVLSRERLAELSKQALSEIRTAGDSKRKLAVDTKSESDRSISASDNTNAPTYEREIKQIQELIDTEKPVYAYFNLKESSVYITDKVENAQAKFRDDAIANLELGDQLNGIRRIELEYAKRGIQDKRYGLEPELDITAPQVEKPQDTKADTIEAKEAEEKTVEMVRGNAFAKLGSEIRNQQVWSESADSWKNPRMDFKVMKENEPLAFKNHEDDTVMITWDNKYSRPNETPVPLNYAEGIIDKYGIDGVKWDLPTVYALKSEPKNLGDKLEVIVTDHKETADALKDKWGYRSLGELKVGNQDTNQKWTSVKDFVGPAYADKLPVWMQKDDIRIEDFIEYQKNKSLTPQEFMLRAQGQPLEHETVPADAWRDRLKPEEHVDQGEAALKERLSRVEKTFAEDKKGKQFNDIKKDLDDLYGRISERSASKEVSEQAEEQKDRADMYSIQIDAFFKLKEANPSLNGQYEQYYDTMVKDMNESVAFMKKSLDQSHRQDIPASSKSETKERVSLTKPVADALRDGNRVLNRIDFFSNYGQEKLLNHFNDTIKDIATIESRLKKGGVSQERVYEEIGGNLSSYISNLEHRDSVFNRGIEDTGYNTLDPVKSVENIKEKLVEFEAKENFVSSVENALGKKGATDKTRQFSEKVYDDSKAKGADAYRMHLSVDVIKQYKDNITAWLDDSETAEIEMNEASKRIMSQVDQLLPRQNEPYADASAQFGREMGIRGTGETMA